MTAGSRFEIRLELARGHWEIEERDEALGCLERALDDASDDPGDPSLAERVHRLAGELSSAAGDAVSEPLRERLRAVLEAAEEMEAVSSGIATSTLASLLEQQGHTDRALRVAEEVLQRNPDDARARAVRERLRGGGGRQAHAVAELERWLVRLGRRRSNPRRGRRSLEEGAEA